MSTKPDSSVKLTPEQIANWRKVLLTMIGGVALILPAERIQEFRDAFQSRLGGEDEKVDKGG